MRLHHIALVGLLGSLLLAGGCGHKKQQLAPPADAQSLLTLRQSYAAINPQAKVGLIIAVMPENALAAVGEIAPADLNTGDTLVLMDSNQQIIGAGTVVAKTTDSVHVHYDVTANGRAPEVGDLAVKAGK